MNWKFILALYIDIDKINIGKVNIYIIKVLYYVFL